MKKNLYKSLSVIFTFSSISACIIYTYFRTDNYSRHSPPPKQINYPQVSSKKSTNDQKLRSVKDDSSTHMPDEDQDAQATYQEVLLLVGQQRNDAIYAILMEEIKKSNFEFVKDELSSSGLDRNQMEIVLAGIANSFPSWNDAIEWINEEFTGDNRRLATATLLFHLVQNSSTDIQALTDFIEDYPLGDDRDSIKSSLIAGWGFKDPLAALNFAKESDEDPRASVDYTASFASHWVSDNFPEALDYFEKASLHENLDALGLEIVRSKIKGDPNSALIWAKNFEGERGDYLRRASIVTWSVINPLDAANYANDILDSSRADYVATVAHRWAWSDPEAVATWERSLTSEVRKSIIPRLANTWYTLDPQAAVVWAQGLDGQLSAIAMNEIEATELSSMSDPIHREVIRDNVRDSFLAMPTIFDNSVINCQICNTNHSQNGDHIKK